MPAVCGVIDRRILLNYRVDAETLARCLPAPFRPQLIDGYGVAGVCLIRLRNVRPVGAPAWIGLRSENAAHRIAVEWTENGGVRNGVYVPRRVTSSRATVLAGGRLFPGVHQHARFGVDEKNDRYQIRIDSDDHQTTIEVDACATDASFQSGLFSTLDDASRFFLSGSCGYSPALRQNEFEGLELDCDRWPVQPLRVSAVRSSFFDDPERFPPGTVEFDCALLMRDVPHRWRQLDNIHSRQTSGLNELQSAC